MLVVIGNSAFSAPLVIKLAHEEPANIEISPAHAAAVVFKDVIETQSNGQMQVQIFAASSQGNQRERIELLKAGIIQVDIASVGGIAQFYPQLSAIDLPFAIPNLAVANTIFDGEFGQKLSADMTAKAGFRLMMLSGGGFYIFTNSLRPIHSPKDMAGIKFRTMSVPSHIALMKSLGATATPIPWDELYGALQTGVVEGQHNPYSAIAVGNLQEVQKYATLTNHLYGADWWLTTDAFMNKLTDDQKRIFTNAAEMAKIAGRGQALILSVTKQGPAFLKKAGMQVYMPTTAEMAEFKKLAIPAISKMIRDELGEEGAKLSQDLLDAASNAEKQLYNGK